jgi:hypothetical protein
VQQPRYPATTSSIRSRRPERSLTSFALGVRGAAPLPAFLTPYKTGAGDPEAICLPREGRRRETRKRSVKPEDSHSCCHSVSKDSGRSRWLDWTRVKSPSLPNFIGCFTIHFTRTQKLLIRELNARDVAEKIELHAAEDVDEAGATPPFAARCVTVSVGSLPPNQFSEGTRSLPRPSEPSAIFTTRLEACMVNGALDTRFTPAFTHPFTLKACETTSDREVMNNIWTRGQHRTGLERPHFCRTMCEAWWVAPAPHACCVTVCSPLS